MMWLEIVMFSAAVLGYLVFNGSAMTSCILARDASPSPDASKDLQIKHSQEDWRAVVSLWRSGTVDDVEECFPLVVESLKRLRTDTGRIVAEVESCLSAQPAPVLNAVLASLIRCKDRDLIDAVVALLPTLPVAPDARSYELLLQAHSVLHNCHEVLTLSARLKQSGVAFSQTMSRSLLGAALQVGAAAEVKAALPLLPGLSQSESVQVGRLCLAQPALTGSSAVRAAVTAAVVHRLLDEGRDVAKVATLCAKCGVVKEPHTYLLMIKAGGPCLDLFHEMQATCGITESLAIALIGASASRRQPSLAAAAFAALKAKGTCLTGAGHAVCAAMVQCYDACGLPAAACDLYTEEIQPSGLSLDSSLAAQLSRLAAAAGMLGLAAELAKPDASRSQHMAQLRSFAKAKDHVGALALFGDLSARGLDSTLLGNCVLDCCVSSDTAAAEQHMKTLQAAGLCDVVSYNTLAKAYLSAGRVDKAQRLVAEMGTRGIKPNQVTYNELLNGLVGFRDTRAMWDLVATMQRARIQPNAVTVSIVLKSLTASSSGRDVDQAMRLADGCVQRDEVLVASVIEACVRVGRLDLLSSKLAQFGGLMAGITAPTYGSMIKAYGKANDVDRVWSLWQSMVGRGLTPTAITLGCMVDALVRSGQAAAARDLVKDLCAKPATAGLANTVVYSTLLKGFCQLKQPSKVMEVYADMQASGVAGNAVSFNTMIDAHCRTGRMDGAEALLAAMVAAGVKPDVITYSTLVKGYCGSGDLDRGLAVSRRMAAAGLQPDEILYNALLDGCAKQQRVDEALALFGQMQEQVRPSTYTVGIMVKLLGRSRRLQQAVDLVQAASAQHGLKPNVQVYTCLLQACLQSRQAGRAVEMHNDMVDQACLPDAKCYSVLARGLLHQGALDKVMAVVRVAHGVPVAGWTAAGRPGVDGRTLDEVAAALHGDNLRTLRADLAQVGARI